AQEIEILHVPGADLKNVGVAVDERDLTRVHDLGDDRHLELVADLAQDLQPLFAQTLKTVGAGPRFVRPAPQNIRTGLLDRAGDIEQDFAALDGAGAGDHCQSPSPNLDPEPDVDDRVFALVFAAGHFERFQDGN